MQADRQVPTKNWHINLWYLSLLAVLVCSAVAAADFTWKPGQGQDKPLERLNINDYPEDPLYQVIDWKIRWLWVGEMIKIPGGSFRMGSNDGDYDELPIHQVDIQAFLLGKYEVTQAQWREVMGNNPATFPGCDNCPVERVSWDDVQSFIKKLNRVTGRRFRLPTESEWEYACRSGGRDEEYCGGSDRSLLAWYGNKSGYTTHPVGQKRANGLELHDMSGNVWEWTQDCWNDSYRGAPSDGKAWQGGICDRRVIRGGSWGDQPRALRSEGRGRGDVSGRFNALGFRLAQDI